MSARDRVDPAKTRRSCWPSRTGCATKRRQHPTPTCWRRRFGLRRARCCAGPWRQRVEVRIPPFAAAVHFWAPAHSRHTPNVVQTDPRTWLLVATGLSGVAQARGSGALQPPPGR
ncbi:sterol carrier family protein [Mycobacterium tuberculosis]